MTRGPWGEGPWGDGSWGGGIDEVSFAGVAALAIRENVIRVEFSSEVYFSGLLDAGDASIVSKWDVAVVDGTSGLTGDDTRPVRVVAVTVSQVEDGVDAGAVGRFLNLTLDRPMTSWPAQYSVSWTSIFSSDLSLMSESALSCAAVYRKVDPPTIAAGRPSLDFANPQTASAALTATGKALAIGTFGIADDGDYATDDGIVNLKKRVIRRLVTAPNAFVHLPGYGVGIPQHAKLLAQPTVVSRLRTEAEAQIAREPDVARVRVTTVQDPNVPNMTRFRIAIRPKVGAAVAFDVPFDHV